MKNTLLKILIIFALIMSLTACSFVESLLPDNGPGGDIGEQIPGGPELPGEKPDEKPEEKPEGDPEEKPEEPVHSHSYTTSVDNPTCTEGGATVYTCSCGDSYSEKIAPLGHSYTESKTEPTCTEAGATIYTCHCGDIYDEPIAALGHSYTESKTEPTCTEAGATTYTCHCGHSYSEPIAALEHSYVKGACTVCGELDPDRDPVIFLAGDSTVKTYENGQYIAGWGQYLSLFLGDEIVVINAAHGGRSSRSFINEGRLYDIPGSSYSFSQNGGHSIADDIQAGDYLFIQFGHNDDASKLSNYATIYDRMVPLGDPDEKGIYPVIPATKMPTSYLPTEYLNAATDADEVKALAELKKYGDEYYAYGSGTYKWYLKQYIDFARSVGAIPVLVTPVARVKFSGDEIIGGAGLHGVNFAYVEAVRQLAEEEDCLLIDLFADTKQMLETATPTYANYLMALKPNELVGTWPVGYDTAYGNAEAGYTGIEATHYNKYAAFLQAAFVAEHILGGAENYSFANSVHLTPESYVDPSNLMSKSSVAAVEALFTTVSVTNPNRSYPSADAVVEQIDALPPVSMVTEDNYIEIGKLCEEARLSYGKLNIDDRSAVTNLATLEALDAAVKAMEIANRPEPSRVVIFDADDLSGTTYNSTVVEGDFTLVATSDKTMEKKSKKATFVYGGITYENTYGLSVGGSATFGKTRYVSFTVDGPCTITVAAQSSSSSSDRILNMVNSSGAKVGSFDAPGALGVTTIEIDSAGTYSIGSAGSGIYIFTIIIEYFD